MAYTVMNVPPMWIRVIGTIAAFDTDYEPDFDTNQKLTE
jgi:hypothetical protein